MIHDTKRINRFIRCVEEHAASVPYIEILNAWLEMGETIEDDSEMDYFLNLIPKIQTRQSAIAGS